MKRLSNKKYIWNGILWCLVGAFVLGWTFFLMGCATPAPAPAPKQFCEQWNTMGDEPNGEPVTMNQRKMFHLGHFLGKSDFVRIMLNEHYDNSLFVDKVVTCYEENSMSLVEVTDFICACSKEAKTDELSTEFSKYINQCIQEVKLQSETK